MKRRGSTVLLYGVLAFGIATAFFLIFGVITAIIPSPYFVRMMPASISDFFFLGTIAVLFGVYIAVTQHVKKTYKKCDAAAYGGTFAGVLSFACPICNAILVTVFGTTALLTYFNPYRPVLGTISIIVLTIAISLRVKQAKKGSHAMSRL